MDILNLAHGLGIGAIAEGVETVEQVELLKTLGCPFAQGNLYSEPVEPDKALKLIRKSRRSRKPVVNR